MLEKLQRKIILRICSEYRTAPTNAVMVLSGTLPTYLLVKERVAL